ncbi:MAG: hypothetical protein A2162_12990 [Deltaproteobacteria bacterium RBG_13_52_11b]|nr:MAG: hypothetical protein A2162_12990 [Deltaproteobacteria bacterium RBG_13_52_11b]
MKKPKLIGPILEQTLKALEIDVPLKSYSIWGAWKEIVGESVALQTQPRSIRNRILFIDVSHPTWIQQLQFLKPTLLKKINSFLGDPPIEDIRFRLGRISPPPPTSSRTPSLKDERLDQVTLNRIENIIQRIGDPEVRKSLKDVLIKGAQLERSRKKQE